MTHDDRNLPIADQSWREHEETLLRFDRAWRDGEPKIRDFLPDGLNREYLLLELAKIDLERRHRLGQAVSAEGYQAEFIELKSDACLLELLREEQRVRRSGDAPLTREELEVRFPSADERQKLLANLTLPSATHGPPAGETTTEVLGKLGRYDLHEMVGTGSFARVYRARDPELKRDVAIKLPVAELIQAPGLRQRLVREAQAAARLNHPGIVPVYEVSESEGRPFIVTEFVEGETLEAAVANRPPTKIEAAAGVAQIAAAAHYAHECGVIHRDIKPANIMRRPDGHLLLTDFGLARQTDAQLSLMQPGDVLGTPAFMSPEQAAGREAVDGRSDVYSLGVVLYWMITGQLPFEGTTASVLQSVIAESPRPPRQLDREIDRDLETICLKCLSKSPNDRYSTAADLTSDLQRYLHHEPILARPVSPTERLWKWVKRRPALAAMAATALLLAGFLGGVALQLTAVRVQRDRAVDAESRALQAESEKTNLLAESYADAGRLAMQRGRFADSLKWLEQSSQMGYSNGAELGLLKIEAKFILREFDAVTALIKGLEEQASTNRQLAGSLAMWRAELALRPRSKLGDPAQFYRESMQHSLSAADRTYVQGMLGVKSVDSVELFEQALLHDPFHHRARTMLVNMLIALGRLEQAEFQTVVAQQLFPEDPQFRLMAGIIHAARGNERAANEILQAAPLNATDRKAWGEVFALVNKLVGITSDTPSLVDGVRTEIVAGLEQAEDSLAIVADYGWRFPPSLGKRFGKVRQSLFHDGNLDKHPARPALESLVDAHPEGMLYVLLGEYQLADNDLHAARDSYLTALESGSLLRNHQEAARLGVIAPTVKLAFVLQDDLEVNLRHAVSALEGLNPESPWPLPRLKLFTQVAGIAGDAELTSRWLERAAIHEDTDPVFVATYRINVMLLRKQFVRALQECDKQIKTYPDEAYFLELRKKAVAEIPDVAPSP